MRLLYTLIALLATAATTMAQTPEIVAEVETLLKAERQSVDVEVMRRLLNKKFGFADTAELRVDPYVSYQSGMTNAFFPQQVTPRFNLNQLADYVTFRPQSTHQLSQLIGPFDGTVLPAGGIVYTLRIPAGSDLTLDPKTNAVGFGNSCGKCHSDVASDGANHQISHKGLALAQACNKCHEGGVSGKQLKDVPQRGDWERTKLEVAIEKVEEIEKPQPKPKADRGSMCQPGDIAEQVIQVLAANAKNLGQWGYLPSKQLAKTDRVMVVITFDELPRQSSGTLAPTGKPGFNPDELQSLNLAGLHLKQQKYKEAVEAFEKGLARYRDGVIQMTASPNTPHDEFVKAMKESEAAIRAMYKQLASAYLQLGDLEKTKKAIDLAANLKLELSAPKTTEKPKPKLPAKLIVSVLKADIDSAKNAEEFRKSVIVERTGFPAIKK